MDGVKLVHGVAEEVLGGNRVKACGPLLLHKFPNSGTGFVLELLKISIQLDKRYPTPAFSKSVFGRLSTRALWQPAAGEMG